MDIITLALAKKFTKDTAVQFGAVKGAPCKVLRTYLNDDGDSVVVFQWKNDADETKQTELVIPKVTNATSTLSEDLTATVSIGSVTAGKTYPEGTDLETIIRDILIKTEKPIISLTASPSQTVWDIVEDSISKITFTATATRKTYNLSNVKFYVGNTVINTQTSVDGLSGVFTFEYEPDTPIKTDTTFKAIVEDVEGGTGSSSLSEVFVGKSYYGFIGSADSSPTESVIKALNPTLKTTKGYVYKNITFTYNKVVYAYPVSFGALTSIKDVVNNINYTDSFSRTTVSVDGMDYYCYTQTKPSKANGVQITFA